MKGDGRIVDGRCEGHVTQGSRQGDVIDEEELGRAGQVVT